jgi:hypothetical protein
LFNVISDYIDRASVDLQERASHKYASAVEVYESRTHSIPHSSANKCFETIRLSANLALQGHRLNTSHESSAAYLAAFGEFQGGNTVLGDGEERPLEAGGFKFLSTFIDVQIKPFKEERYQIELFLPKFE